ncbi:MAG TPA: hypothetical protein VKT51_11930 [Candidatus Eremiobacteraceae bacterium]|nr:hypothetical protein [Candidatus Eremiobacteraceae bacterium]
MLRKVTLIAVPLLVIAASSLSPLDASTTGVLSGHIFDEHFDGTRLPFLQGPVRVDACRAFQASACVETTPNSRGFFSFISLSPGGYFLRAAVAGTSIGSTGCARYVVDADGLTVADLGMYDSSKIIADCFEVQTIYPETTASVYSFDGGGYWEP